ncbi:MAG TPA: RecQ family ATP-dependent DNA helicase, partial [Thermoanaerobaculia bacterium]|nr:RecQ family ATP-dependent DNA helicase [Thermoanaerobaculia bacterium]
SYRALGLLRDEFPGVAIHAFTATATERVRGDIVDQLGLDDARILVGSFDRPNLVYRVQRRRKAAEQLRQVIERHPDEAGIVYCVSRREVEETAETVASWGVSAVPYHAGLPDHLRHKHQEDFLQERVQVVVATVAFGMGIDRSNVRFVVHTTSPRSLEHYQQEAGRAGRDGLEAECVLLHSPADYHTWRRLVAKDGEPSASDMALLSGMQRYAGTPRCRHKALLEYFGQTLETDGDDGCGACDFCLGELDDLEEVGDPLVLAQKILSCVVRLRESFGVTHVVDVLRGSEAEKVTSRGHHALSTWGLLDDEPTRQVRSWIEQLIDQGHLVQTGDRYPVLAVTERGWQAMRGEADATPQLHREPARRTAARKPSKASAADWEGVDRDLFEALRELRLEVAREREVPPYIIFHDSMLRDMARLKPRSEAELLEVYGVGEKKASDLGPAFLAAIAEWEEQAAE